jgi:16S rRNA (cytosine967-C5)-methyltransferase
LAKNNVSPARKTAFDILLKVAGGSFSSTLLASEEPCLSLLDRALCHELVLGVLRWQLNLDRCIEHFANRKVESLDQPVRVALRLGLYQLRFLSRIPASAAVNESVNLVHLARLSSARSFVNAVLRRASREPQYDPVDQAGNTNERISIETSHPLWLIERWTTRFGLEETAAFARANNETPPTTFRIVKSKANKLEVLDRLNSAGATLESSKVVPEAWRVSGATSVLRELVELGLIYLQDEASQLVAHLVDAKAGEKILDLCAAPGGKTTLLAANAQDKALVIAGDFSSQRLETLRRTVIQQQLASIIPMVLDGTSSLPFAAVFDRVLVDAPCSGTGTLRHNPEIRWRITETDILKLASEQKKMLMNAARVVKPGGRLIYSTCSVEPEENEEVVADFLQSADEFRIVPQPSFATESGSIRTWPQHNGTDGFFVTLFERTLECAGPAALFKLLD